MQKLIGIPVKTADELAEMEVKMRKEGKQIVPFDNAETGCIGFVGFFEVPQGRDLEKEPWTAELEDAKLYQYPKFGKPLEPENVVVTDANTLATMFTAHCEHPHFRIYNDSFQRTLGFVCYCQHETGKALVIRVPISTFKGLPQELADLLLPRKPAAPAT